MHPHSCAVTLSTTLAKLVKTLYDMSVGALAHSLLQLEYKISFKYLERSPHMIAMVYTQQSQAQV